MPLFRYHHEKVYVTNEVIVVIYHERKSEYLACKMPLKVSIITLEQRLLPTGVCIGWCNLHADSWNISSTAFQGYFRENAGKKLVAWSKFSQSSLPLKDRLFSVVNFENSTEITFAQKTAFEFQYKRRRKNNGIFLLK